MEFEKIKNRALEIRGKYSELEKEKYGREWTPGEIMQGFVGDVGDLMKLVMAKQGIRSYDKLDEKIGHELADCLWSILILANKFNIDIEKNFLSTMDDLDEKITNKLK